jgi:hypothetical protein
MSFHSTSKSEKYFERKLKESIKKKGGLCIKLLSIHHLGLPDRMCLLPGGIIFFCEIKSTGFEPSPIQKFVAKQLTGLGFNYYIVDNIDLINKLTGDDDSKL